MKKVQYLLELALQLSDAVTEDCSPRIRPLMKVVVYLCSLLFMLLLIPIMSPYWAILWIVDRMKRPTITPCMKLDTELQSTWYSESSQVALAKLRHIRQQLIEHDMDRLGKGIHLAPYGTFKMWDYLQVLWLLYHYEMSHGHWNEAHMVCDEVLELFGGETSRWLNFMRQFTQTDEWIVNKAKVLVKLEGDLAAQEYLLKYLYSDHHDNPINTYFYELRRAPGVPPSKDEEKKKEDVKNKNKMEETKEQIQDNTTNPRGATTDTTNIVKLPRHRGQTGEGFSE